VTHKLPYFRNGTFDQIFYFRLQTAVIFASYRSGMQLRIIYSNSETLFLSHNRLAACKVPADVAYLHECRVDIDTNMSIHFYNKYEDMIRRHAAIEH